MMRSGSQKLLPALGFLTVTCDPDQGLFGGYLVLNLLGRPLEFHCTAPVRPNRAQAILYGPSLDPYLCGERIGHTLLEKGRVSPRLVFTDRLPVMAARPLVATSLVLVCGAASQTFAGDGAAGVAATGTAETAADERAASARTQLPGLLLERFALGAYQLGVLAAHPDDRAQVAEYWPHFADQIALEEPFGRIREAIDEARSGAA
jgi:hypothetical protein